MISFLNFDSSLASKVLPLSSSSLMELLSSNKIVHQVPIPHQPIAKPLLSFKTRLLEVNILRLEAEGGRGGGSSGLIVRERERSKKREVGFIPSDSISVICWFATTIKVGLRKMRKYYEGEGEKTRCSEEERRAERD
uniref:Uncharacterized protein n=1 Tax=Nelumbo nucifera TaxID=4432 RepID=A0A822ZX98_NELNU|nr:TPA_asm: hypothetical protein HUJ06_017786 [Nelumbo nucifera]